MKRHSIFFIFTIFLLIILLVGCDKKSDSNDSGKGNSSGNSENTKPDEPEKPIDPVDPISEPKYTATWLDWDDTVLFTTELRMNELSCNYYQNHPTRQDTPEYNYEFYGWNTTEDRTNLTVVYKAQYNCHTKEYAIFWHGIDNNILQSEFDIPYSQIDNYSYNGEIPQKEADKQYGGGAVPAADHSRSGKIPGERRSPGTPRGAAEAAPPSPEKGVAPFSWHAKEKNSLPRTGPPETPSPVFWRTPGCASS